MQAYARCRYQGSGLIKDSCFRKLGVLCAFPFGVIEGRKYQGQALRLVK